MSHPLTRVPTLLELLQSNAGLTEAELADRLNTDVRTVRRYIAHLRELGIPVEAERGRYGGYEVTIHGPLDAIARRLPRSAVTLTAQPTGVLVHARAERLDAMAHLLASLEWPFTIHRPDELRQALKNLADQLTAAAQRGPEERPR